MCRVPALRGLSCVDFLVCSLGINTCHAMCNLQSALLPFLILYKHHTLALDHLMYLPTLDATSLLHRNACTCPHHRPHPGPPVTCSPRPQKASAVDAVALAAAAEAYQGPSLPLGDLHHPQGTGAPTYVPRRLQVQEAATQIRLAVQQANTSEVRRAVHAVLCMPPRVPLASLLHARLLQSPASQCHVDWPAALRAAARVGAFACTPCWAVGTQNVLCPHRVQAETIHRPVKASGAAGVRRSWGSMHVWKGGALHCCMDASMLPVGMPSMLPV